MSWSFRHGAGRRSDGPMQQIDARSSRPGPDHALCLSGPGRDTRSLLIPSLRRSEIFGFLAGFGTTFAAAPDLTAMLRRRSSVGMNPRMATIMGALKILWVLRLVKNDSSSFSCGRG